MSQSDTKAQGYSRLGWELAQLARLRHDSYSWIASLGPMRTGDDKFIIGVGRTTGEATQDLARKLDRWAQEAGAEL